VARAAAHTAGLGRGGGRSGAGRALGLCGKLEEAQGGEAGHAVRVEVGGPVEEALAVRPVAEGIVDGRRCWRRPLSERGSATMRVCDPAVSHPLHTCGLRSRPRDSNSLCIA
jgi:hypothetical protein